MPHSTPHSTGSHMRAASQSRSSTARPPIGESNGAPGQGGTEKFPDFDAGHALPNGPTTTGQRWQQNGYAYGNGSATNPDRWHARRDSRVRWAPREPLNLGHGKKNSISNAIHRMRSGSMSQNAHEIADALRAPVSWKLIVCLPAHEPTSRLSADSPLRRCSASCGTGRPP